MRILLLLFTFNFSLAAHAQQRVGLDINTRLNNIYLSGHYQSVIKGPFLISGGFYFGHMGLGDIRRSVAFIEAGNKTHIPFAEIPFSISDTSTTFTFKDYSTKARSIGLQFGVGFFHEFGNYHGIRFNLRTKFGVATTKVSSYYYSTTAQRIAPRSSIHKHYTGAISAELYHTMRLTGRWTFYWGVRVPYFYSLSKQHYNPIDPADILFGFEPNLSLGFTRTIGNCQ